ncbi:MAG: non-canonical purine NTP pyrophosphatase [Candidatus Shapirobacteria bacterium]
MIYIATTNIDKYKNISYQIRLLNPSLKIKTIVSFNIKPPDENGKNEKENCLIKAKCYYSIIKKAIISEDSGVYFDHLSIDLQPSSVIRNKNFDINSPIDYWRQYIIKNKINTGKIIKYYCIACKDKYFICKIIVPVTFNTDLLTPNPSITNFFNYLMIPKGYPALISNLTHQQKDDLYKQYYLPSLKKIFQNSGFK